MARPTIAFNKALAILGVVLAVGVVGHVVWRGTHIFPTRPQWVVPGGDPERGRNAILQYGCVSCHSVPGMRVAQGRVGPQLYGIVEQGYIAGVLPNSPDNMIIWIRDPQAVNPLTAMPTLGVTEQDARDMTAYLFSRPERLSRSR